MSDIRLLHSNIDSELLESDVLNVLEKHDSNNSSLNLSSASGNEWHLNSNTNYDGKPYLADMLNEEIRDTYLAQVLNTFRGYYRWRIVTLDPPTTYSIHKDFADDRNLKYHYRIHIPVISNAGSLLFFFNNDIQKNNRGTCRYYRLVPGNCYLFNASNYHTAINCGGSKRIHIIGQKSKSKGEQREQQHYQI